jgi:hypothetical protein
VTLIAVIHAVLRVTVDFGVYGEEGELEEVRWDRQVHEKGVLARLKTW